MGLESSLYAGEVAGLLDASSASLAAEVVVAVSSSHLEAPNHFHCHCRFLLLAVGW